MKNRLLLISIVLISWQGFSCECNPTVIQELDSVSLASADLVIVGEVYSRSENGYQIKIQQILKGISNAKTIMGVYTNDMQYDVSSCTFYPRKKTDYLPYLFRIEHEKEEYYYASQCLASRSLDGSVGPIGIVDMNTTEVNEWTQKWINKIG